jgi:methylglutaconyl-CoA hydratase
MSEATRVLYGAEDGVATLTLNRPEKRNALDDQMIAELKDAFARAERDPEARVILLRGAGPDFCTGADLSQLERIASGADPIENLADASALADVFIRMRRLNKPIIAAVHGHVFAGGAGLATAADLVVAAEDAVFGYPEVLLGFVPSMVMVLLRRVASEKVAFELLARGDRIGAAEAQRLGLVNRVFARATFEEDAREYARELASRSPSAVRLIKRLLYGLDGASFEDALARGAEINALARFSEDTRQGVRRFLERRRKS